MSGAETATHAAGQQVGRLAASFKTLKEENVSVTKVNQPVAAVALKPTEVM